MSLPACSRLRMQQCKESTHCVWVVGSGCKKAPSTGNAYKTPTKPTTGDVDFSAVLNHRGFLPKAATKPKKPTKPVKTKTKISTVPGVDYMLDLLEGHRIKYDNIVIKATPRNRMDIQIDLEVGSKDGVYYIDIDIGFPRGSNHVPYHESFEASSIAELRTLVTKPFQKTIMVKAGKEDVRNNSNNSNNEWNNSEQHSGFPAAKLKTFVDVFRYADSLPPMKMNLIVNSDPNNNMESAGIPYSMKKKGRELFTLGAMYDTDSNRG